MWKYDFFLFNNSFQIFEADKYEDVTDIVKIDEIFEVYDNKCSLEELLKKYVYDNIYNIDPSLGFRILKFEDISQDILSKELGEYKSYSFSDKNAITKRPELIGYFFKGELTCLQNIESKVKIKKIFDSDYYDICVARLFSIVKEFKFYKNDSCTWFYIYKEGLDLIDDYYKTETEPKTYTITEYMHKHQVKQYMLY